jgi:AraC family transcriptional regulator
MRKRPVSHESDARRNEPGRHPAISPDGSDEAVVWGADWCVPVGSSGPRWTGLPVALWPIIDRGEMVGHYRATPVLLVGRSGTGKRFYRSGTVRRELCTVPGIIDLYGPGFSLDHGRWEGTRGECIGVEFPAPLVGRLLLGESQRFQPATRYELFDDQLAELVFAMWKEASSGATNGRLFAEGLSVALLALLSARYGGAAAAAATRSIRCLSSGERKRVAELIDSALEADLSVERLAQAIGVSPFHFSRMFKATFGRTPHRFVLERRIDAASAVLSKDRHRPIADIALAFGFAAQAHFTQAFRRRMGVTPARWRRERFRAG